MSSVLQLASSIATMDRGALNTLAFQRQFHSPGAISDPITLASELLRSDSIRQALCLLERGDLAVLLGLGSGAYAEDRAEFEADFFARSALPGFVERQSPVLQRVEHLKRLGLVGLSNTQFSPLAEVTEMLFSLLKSNGINVECLSHEAVEVVSGDSVEASSGTQLSEDSAAWFAAALTEVTRAAWILRILTGQPGRINQNGSVSAATVRMLSEVLGCGTEHTARTLVTLEQSCLTVTNLDDHLLCASAQSAHWLASEQVERWGILAEARLANAHDSVRAALAGNTGGHLLAELRHRFPLLPETLTAQAEQFALAAEELGLTVHGRLSAPALALLAGDPAGARAIAQTQMPDTVAGVYVQPDLSIVVPGPLCSDDDADLAVLTRPEQFGVASTLRVTEASLSAAFERGVSADTMRHIFHRLSLTGVPQPLSYLIDSLALRFGSIIVCEHAGVEGRTRLRLARVELRDTLLVDRSLAHLQLTCGHDPSSPELFSRLRVDHVVVALNNARYAVTVERDERLAPLPFAAPTKPLPLSAELAAAVERVYQAANAEPGIADFTRFIELAIRDRSPLRVSAAARGESRDYTLVPLSLHRGRLRALDQRAGVERTLAVASIVSLAPAK